MANRLNDAEQHDHSSRRGFFKWIGQAVAGASLAGMGISALNPLNVQAANAQPNCTQCDGCSVISCAVNGSCRTQGYLYLVTYYAYYGCVNPGDKCPYSKMALCANSCSCA